MALKFYSSQRIDVRKKETIAGPIKEGPARGIKVKAKIIKNKTAPPHGEAMFDLLYDRGIDQVGSTVDGALLANVIDRRGAYYYYVGDGQDLKLGQGREAVVKYLEQEDQAELRSRMYELALERINGGHCLTPPSDSEGSDTDSFETAGM
jgi:recombination protein RecA